MQSKLFESITHVIKILKTKKNLFNLVLKIKKLLRLWRMRNLSIAGKITVFKTLEITKILQLALVNVIPNAVILELDKLNKHFI